LTIKPKLKAAQTFLSQLDSDTNTFDFRAIWPKNKGKTRPVVNLRGSLDEHGAQLSKLNTEGHGIYVVVNKTDGKGIRAENVTKIRAVWADWDHGLPEIETLPLQPSVWVSTSEGKAQAYWFADGMEESEFTSVMSEIVARFNADPGAKSLCQVLRVPGFYHTKGDNPTLVVAKYLEDGDGYLPMYKAGELVEAFTRRAKTEAKALTNLPSKCEWPIAPHSAEWAHLDALLKRARETRDNWVLYDDHRACEFLFNVLDANEGNLLCKLETFKQSMLEDEEELPISYVAWEDAAARRERDYGPRPEGAAYVLATVKDDVSTGEKMILRRFIYPELRANGKPDAKSRRNVQAFLKASETEVWLDEFSERVYLKREGKVTQLNDRALRDWMFAMREASLMVDKDSCNDAILNAAENNPKHPVREYLASLKWDGKKRISTWLTKYAGVEDTSLHRAYSRMFLIGAVRRVKKPGTKMRSMLILEGPQNIGKSRLFKKLAVEEEWFTDNVKVGDESKEVIEITCGKWICETPELSGLSKRDVEHVKAMISRDTDKARKAYDRFPSEVARHFILCGTTNPTPGNGYLKDRTGNTRFWGVTVGEMNVDGLTRKVIDQLWAEAVVAEARGEQEEPHWLNTDELQEEQRKSAEVREEVSEMEQKWIDTFRRTERDVFIPSEAMYRVVGLESLKDVLAHYKTSLGFAAKRVGWQSGRKRVEGRKEYGYYAEGEVIATLRLGQHDKARQCFVPKAESRVHTHARTAVDCR